MFVTCIIMYNHDRQMNGVNLNRVYLRFQSTKLDIHPMSKYKKLLKKTAMILTTK